MQLGYIGLGKMGYNMVLRLLEKKYKVIVSNRSLEPVRKAEKKGAISTKSSTEVLEKLKTPRLIWVMVPYTAVEEVLKEITPMLKKGDTVIDGGNSPYVASIRRAKKLKKIGVHFLDAGVSGGPEGARKGACIMVGGAEKIYKKRQKLFRDLSAPKAYGYMGPSGAGHFVKMVHNGIEYGMMQAIAEGFAVMRKSKFKLNLTEVARVYSQKSVIESRLISWLQNAYKEYGEDLDEVSGKVSQSGEGLWTVEAAAKFGVETPIIKGSAGYRKKTQKKSNYTGKIISALRGQFGGHSVKITND